MAVRFTLLRMRLRSTKLDTVSQIRLQDLAPRYTGQGTARCLWTLRSPRGTRIPSTYVLASPSRYRRDTRPSHCFSLIPLAESAPGYGMAYSAVCQQGCDIQRQTLKTASAGQARDGLSTIESTYTVKSSIRGRLLEAVLPAQWDGLVVAVWYPSSKRPKAANLFCSGIVSLAQLPS